MENKECKIVCNDKTVATISCNKDGMKIVPTKEGKEMCKDVKGCCD
ncbi:MAG: hypothetical protein HZC47_02375 [Methanobacterium sp.]|nr:hypothetical protein [Methanobacterium sp.]